MMAKPRFRPAYNTNSRENIINMASRSSSTSSIVHGKILSDNNNVINVTPAQGARTSFNSNNSSPNSSSYEVSNDCKNNTDANIVNVNYSKVKKLATTNKNNSGFISSKNRKLKHVEYQLKNKIGHGAYGVVYRAVNKITNKDLAIKVVTFEDDEELLNDHMVEIDLLKNLKHPNIVKYHGFIQKQTKLYILLELCSNGSLRDLIKSNGGPLNESTSINYVKQTLQGLTYLHEQGVIHRDIKAANLLLDNKNVIKLADFGVSTKVTNVAMTCVGSPNWMAPEILLGQGATTKSDIWSVGATVVEILTGDPPFFNLNREAVCYAVMHDVYHIPSKFKLSKSVIQFIAKCFAKNIFERPSAKTLLEDDPWINQTANGNLVKLQKLKKFKEHDEDGIFFKDFGEDGEDFGSPHKEKCSLNNTEGEDTNSPISTAIDSLSINNISTNEDPCMSGSILLQEFKKQQNFSGNTMKCMDKIIKDCEISQITGVVIYLLYSRKDTVIIGLFELFVLAYKSKKTDFLVEFNKSYGMPLLIDYICFLKQIKDEKKDALKWLKLLNNLESICNFPILKDTSAIKLVDIELCDNFEMIKFVIHLSVFLINCNTKIYSELVGNKWLPAVLKNLKKVHDVNDKTSIQIIKDCQYLLYETTQNGISIGENLLREMTHHSSWNHTVLKCLNNLTKVDTNHNNIQALLLASHSLGISESSSATGSNTYNISSYVFQWLTNVILPTIKTKLENLDASNKQLSKSDFKTTRYFIELVYNISHTNQTYKTQLISNIDMPVVCKDFLRIHKNIPQDSITHYSYLIKFVIRLSAELTSEISLKNTQDLLIKYCETAFTFLDEFPESTYTWCAIEVLSNCLPKITNLEFSPTEIILPTSGTKVKKYSINSIVFPLFNDRLLNSQDFENVFKKLNKLLMALTTIQKANDEHQQDKRYSNNFIMNDFFQDDKYIGISSKLSSTNIHGLEADTSNDLNYISPIAQLIVGNPQFVIVVVKILEKFKGSLIIQIDFLKFLKNVFWQYVEYRFTEYTKKEREQSSMVADKSGQNNKKIDYLQIALKAQNKYTSNNFRNSDQNHFFLKARTHNLRDVNDILIKLWENESTRVGYNSILIKQLVKDINKIYNESITFA
ncbi:uncharacterized protein SCODWIG_02429 [Saccharomycodes ludwigii]|uniref:non-specific serine/threonine protein kinase n=1 Tax=Saccharomycodes ludwigii TaxID=36035 RepID=A0A376B7M5_9ASCO|nr:hypothetical protein SCDLUD_005102 [Saccharomycodes ludwigii]KAH3898767.1 hypothetical protein SCDLUD_005102 [Saccharomycodes ludwigii]SSD60668.1 uncharacterized protein SCODWIG_02429 [Saccharomycodes ludwigii]